MQLTTGQAIINCQPGSSYYKDSRRGLYLVNIWSDQIVQFVEDPVNHFHQQMAFLREGGKMQQLGIQTCKGSQHPSHHWQCTWSSSVGDMRRGRI